MSSKKVSSKLSDKLTKKKKQIEDIIIESDEENEPENKNIKNKSVEIRTKELEVKCLELLDQILLRPDTYIGTVVRLLSKIPIWVVKNSKFEMVKPTFSEGLLRLFVEIMSNAIDNIWRSKEFGVSCKTIKIYFDRKTGRTTIWNDGKAIPINIQDKVYVPELVFSRLLSSTNYDDTEKRKTSGRNGYGAKLTNIFSTNFDIEIYNPTEKKIYKQSWSQNMSKRTDPVITNHTDKMPELGKNAGYTKVSWIPDFKRFKLETYDDDIISLYEKYVYDTSMIASKYGVKVYVNDKLISISSLKDYALLYTDIDEDDEVSKKEIMTFKTEDSTVVVFPNDKQLNVSFVNGIHTNQGGVHVENWCESIFRPIVNNVNGVKVPKNKKKLTKAQQADEDKKKKKKKENEFTIDIGHVKKRFAIFIDVELDNPVFIGQNKNELASPSVETKVTEKDISKIMKWSVIDVLKRSLDLKSFDDLEKNKKGFSKVEGLDDANFAKTPSKRIDCILGISEGLSARTYIVEGMKYGVLSRTGKLVKGRDYIGTLPVKGKVINPQDKSVKTVLKNKEVRSLIKAIGLKADLDYTDEENQKTLRYHRVIVWADADKDGIHIVGLIYNFFHTLYPTVLQIPGFFCFGRTPIMKINHNGEKLVFYCLEQGRKFIEENNINKKAIKYYKGLGTSNPKDIREDFGKRICELVHDEETTDDIITNIFSKKKANFRKKWLLNFDPSSVSINEGIDNEMEELDVFKFINEEFVTFSIADCDRSIPNILDGLKTSQRKILFSLFKRKAKYTGSSIKVAQLTGYTAEHSGYHHGENNLIDTIRGMAVRYVGSNNLPLFYNDGAFGSRLANGKDGANGRYIYTKLEMFTRNLFPIEDDEYLEDLDEDGDIVEKKYYLPIIPMILVNGCLGIGTGFSTSIPSYDPFVLIEWVKTWIKTKGNVIEDLGNGVMLSEGPDLIPWYRNFKGKIERTDNKIVTSGVIEKMGKNKFRVTEIPIGKKCLSISKFKNKLEELLEKKAIKDFDDHSDASVVDFIITEDPDGININLESLGLIDVIHTTNMVLFDSKSKIKKFNSPEEIINDFCKSRYDLFVKRRAGEIDKYKKELLYTNNKIRFIKEVNLPDDDKNKLVIKDREDEELYNEMDNKKYDRKITKKKEKKKEEDEEKEEVNDEDEEEDNSNEGTFNYLLDLKMRGAMKKRMDLLLKEKEKLEKKIKELEEKSEYDIWTEELDVLKTLIEKWLPYADEARDDYESGGGKKKGKSKKGKK
jgi:DNA topoisomerase-2